MAINIVDVNTFTATVTTVADGEAGDQVEFAKAPQALANRTRHNKNRIDALNRYCYASITGSAVANPDEFTLAIADESGGFTVSGNNIVIPTTGVYEVSMFMLVTSSDATNPLQAGVAIRLAGTTFADVEGMRLSANTGTAFTLISPPRPFAATATNQISLTAGLFGDPFTTSNIAPPEARNFIYIRGIS